MYFSSTNSIDGSLSSGSCRCAATAVSPRTPRTRIPMSASRTMSVFTSCPIFGMAGSSRISFTAVQSSEESTTWGSSRGPSTNTTRSVRPSANPVKSLAESTPATVTAPSPASRIRNTSSRHVANENSDRTRIGVTGIASTISGIPSRKCSRRRAGRSGEGGATLPAKSDIRASLGRNVSDSRSANSWSQHGTKASRSRLGRSSTDSLTPSRDPQRDRSARAV